MNRKKWNWELGILGVLMMGFVAGCGGQALSPNLVTDPIGQELVVVTKNLAPENLEKFDGQLAAIQDADSARDAVDMFADHVAAQVSPSVSGVVVGIKLMSKDKLDLLARKELEIRRGLKLHADDPTVGISSQKVAEALNGLVLGSEVNPVRADEIESAKEGVRVELPHISPAKSANMTPLEAMTVAYSFTTGDGGAGMTPDVAKTVTPNKVEEFIDRLLE